MSDKIKPEETRPASLAAKLDMLLETSQLNASTLTQMRADIAELRDLLAAWRSAKGAIRVIQLFGALVKWCAVIGGSTALLWYSIKHGEWKL